MDTDDIKLIDEIMNKAKLNTTPTDNDDLPEAANVANVKVWIKGFGVMFTMRDRQLDNNIKQVEDLIQIAQESGWKSTWDTSGTSTTATSPKKATTVSELCGVHGVALVRKQGVSKVTNKPYNFIACPQRNEDGSFCSYKPKQT